MNYEIEYDSRISNKAIIYTIIFHLLLLAFTLVFEIQKAINYTDRFVNVSFIQSESTFPEEKTELAKIPIPEKIEEVKPFDQEIIKELIPLKIEEPTAAFSDETNYVIDESFNSLLDSVLYANPTVYGLKNMVKERMKKEDEKKKFNLSPIETAREQLKIQLVTMYKDRYGDISPDKYAAQLHQTENVLTIPIPLGPIINLLKDLF